MSTRSQRGTCLGMVMLTLASTVGGCGNGGAVGLAAARARCNESRMAGSGVPLTDADWEHLVATHTEARDEGLSRNNAITFGNRNRSLPHFVRVGRSVGNPMKEGCRRSRHVLGVGSRRNSSGRCGRRLRPESPSWSSGFGNWKRSSSKTRRTRLGHLRAIHRRRSSVPANRRPGACRADSRGIRVMLGLAFRPSGSTRLCITGLRPASDATGRCPKPRKTMIPNRPGIKWRKCR